MPIVTEYREEVNMFLDKFWNAPGLEWVAEHIQNAAGTFTCVPSSEAFKFEHILNVFERCPG